MCDGLLMSLFYCRLQEDEEEKEEAKKDEL